MKRIAHILLAILAVGLIPVTLYLALTNMPEKPDVELAFWGPFAVLAADAILFFLMLGFSNVTRWERVGISLIAPMLLTMASWAAMRGMVVTQMGG